MAILNMAGAVVFTAAVDTIKQLVIKAASERADLRGAKHAELVIAQIQFIPVEGSFVGWKKCEKGVVVKLSIPDDAKRSHGTERKCRASHVLVLDVVGADVGISLHDGKTEYRKGETVTADSFCEDRWETCANGIHCYLTREEANAHS